jgi:hypothetical protein
LGVRASDAPRLPCVTELFPELLDKSIPDNDRPSCSVPMSLAAQGLFINDVVVRFASHLLIVLEGEGRATRCPDQPRLQALRTDRC